MSRISKRNAYSLVEIAVAMIVVAILAVLLLGVLRFTNSQSKNVKCISNLQQMAIGINAYRATNNMKLPFLAPDAGWISRLVWGEYVPAMSFVCPEAKDNSGTDFYASIDPSTFYDGTPPSTGEPPPPSSPFGGDFFMARTGGPGSSFNQAQRGTASFTQPFYMIFTEPLASDRMMKKYIWQEIIFGEILNPKRARNICELLEILYVRLLAEGVKLDSEKLVPYEKATSSTEWPTMDMFVFDNDGNVWSVVQVLLYIINNGDWPPNVDPNAYVFANWFLYNVAAGRYALNFEQLMTANFRDSRYSVSQYNAETNKTGRTVISDLRNWAAKDGNPIAVRFNPTSVEGHNPQQYYLQYRPLDRLPAYSSMLPEGETITDTDTMTLTESPNAMVPSSGGGPFQLAGPGATGTWIWNEYISPTQMRVRTMVHKENRWLPPYFSYQYDVVISTTPQIPPDYVAPGDPVPGTGPVEIGTLSRFGINTLLGNYGANILAGNVRKGVSFRTDEVAPDTILILDYGTFTVNWASNAVTGDGQNVTVVGAPIPELQARHRGKVNVLRMDGSVEAVTPSRIRAGWWTPKAGD